MKAKVVADSKQSSGICAIKKPFKKGEVKFHYLNSIQCKIAFNHVDIKSLWHYF